MTVVLINEGEGELQTASRLSNNNLQESIEGKGDTKAIDVELFPNPATNVIYINFSRLQIQQKGVLTILDLLGGILKRYPVVISGKSLQGDISSLNDGTFTITLMVENINITKKFIKAK
jgi:hypothetical protein